MKISRWGQSRLTSIAARSETRREFSRLRSGWGGAGGEPSGEFGGETLESDESGHAEGECFRPFHAVFDEGVENNTRGRVCSPRFLDTHFIRETERYRPLVAGKIHFGGWITAAAIKEFRHRESCESDESFRIKRTKPLSFSIYRLQDSPDSPDSRCPPSSVSFPCSLTSFSSCPAVRWEHSDGQLGATRWRGGSNPVARWKLPGDEVEATRCRGGSYPVAKWELPGDEVEATRWQGGSNPVARWEQPGGPVSA